MPVALDRARSGKRASETGFQRALVKLNVLEMQRRGRARVRLEFQLGKQKKSKESLTLNEKKKEDVVKNGKENASILDVCSI